MRPVSRREVLGRAGVAGFAAAMPRMAFAFAPGDRRLIVVLLRGALDGLGAVPVYGDPDFVQARRGLALPSPNEPGGVLKLDATFGLHPDLPKLYAMFGRGELAVVHAVASPYRDRSHFDAQNVLENGGDAPLVRPDGWLNRALAGLPAQGTRTLGLAVAPNLPLMMRGPSEVVTWSPSSEAAPDADTIRRVAELYQRTDPRLAAMFDAACRFHAATRDEGGRTGLVGSLAAAASFMRDDHGPSVVMVEATGWDTHTNQNASFGLLRKNLRLLDEGLDTFRLGLGDRWNSTAVLVVTEFGRAVAQNGAAGTDHGTGAAAFLLGGAVSGGKVVADWPGLKAHALYEGRDLRPTTDLRSLLKTALVAHMHIDDVFVGRSVFPDSSRAALIPGLFRG